MVVSAEDLESHRFGPTLIGKIRNSRSGRNWHTAWTTKRRATVSGFKRQTRRCDSSPSDPTGSQSAEREAAVGFREATRAIQDLTKTLSSYFYLNRPQSGLTPLPEDKPLTPVKRPRSAKQILLLQIMDDRKASKTHAAKRRREDHSSHPQQKTIPDRCPDHRPQRRSSQWKWKVIRIK